MTRLHALPIVASLACLAGAPALLDPAAVSAAGQSSEASPSRVVYLSAFDKDGRPVDDLSADDFTVKEGGKAVEIVRAGPDDSPMQVAILVDDSGTGLFRSGLVRFIQRLQGRAAFSITAVVGQPLKLVDFTMGGDELVEAVTSLSARPGTPDGGQLLQGIYDAAKDLEKREAPRPVILVLTIPGEEHSTLPARYVLDQLRDSGASLHVFSTASSASRQRVAVNKASALLEENLSLSEVLGDGPKQSGGRREEIVASAGIVAGLQQLADELIHQYAVSYDLPAGVKSSDRLTVSVKRKGVTLRAPSRIPKL
jgi:hypothetical protein